MGEVYRARDIRLGRLVALKVLPDTFAADPRRRARFLREAQVLASLNHSNISTLHGVEELDGRLVLVLELVEGETLGDRLARASAPLPVREVVPIARQIVDALDAAHELGIVHRDLKPSARLPDLRSSSRGAQDRSARSPVAGDLRHRRHPRRGRQRAPARTGRSGSRKPDHPHITSSGLLVLCTTGEWHAGLAADRSLAGRPWAPDPAAAGREPHRARPDSGRSPRFRGCLASPRQTRGRPRAGDTRGPWQQERDDAPGHTAERSSPADGRRSYPRRLRPTCLPGVAVRHVDRDAGRHVRSVAAAEAIPDSSNR